MESGREIRRLNELAAEYRRAQHAAKEVRQRLDEQIRAMKRAGYSFPVLAREAGLAQGTIHNIVAADRNSHQYWRQRCTLKRTAGSFCDVRFPDQPGAWCEPCAVARKIVGAGGVDMSGCADVPA